MFETVAGKLGNVDTHQLVNAESGTRAIILSGAGASLNEFTTSTDRGSLNVVDGYKDEADFASRHAIQFKGAKLSPFPNRIKAGRYRFDGEDYQLGINFPNEGHRIHGLLYQARFEETERWSSKEEAGVKLSHHYAGGMTGFPFAFAIYVRFAYRRNELTCRTVVVNEGPSPMPLGDGWHPYFTTGSPIDDLRLQFPASHKIEVGPDRIPKGRSEPYRRFGSLAPLRGEEFDDCFRLEEGDGKARTVLSDWGKDISLTVWQETGKGKYNYLQIYTPPGRESIALEPMTCPPDAFNNGIDLIRLAPKERASFSWGIEVSPT